MPSREWSFLCGVAMTRILFLVGRFSFGSAMPYMEHGVVLLAARRFSYMLCLRRRSATARCRRKIEMSLGVQSRDDTRVPDGHEERDLGCIFSGELSSAFDCRAGSGLSYDVGDR